jgi:hypothetical protein
MRRSGSWVGAVLLALLSAAPAAAITVQVDGRPLPSAPPAVQVRGRVLLPMRAVWEGLGATVRWEAATRTIVGVRADTVVRMEINRNIAYINDHAVALDVPPLLVHDRAYVPVRFAAEALGADVRWEGVTRTVYVTLPPADVDLPGPGSVAGVIVLMNDTQVVLAVDGRQRPFAFTRDTSLLQDGRPVDPTGLRRGSLAQVEHDGQGIAVRIVASLATVTGIVAEKAPDRLLLGTQLYAVDPEVEVTTADGVAARYEDIRVGDRVTLAVTPATTTVFGIIAEILDPKKLLVETNDPKVFIVTDVVLPPTVEITAFRHDADAPLKAGDVLTVTLEGTPGGVASFDLVGVRTALPLPENPQQPGRYRAVHQIEAGLNAVNVPVIGRLAIAGAPAVTTRAAERITIDTIPPRVSIEGPGPGDRIPDGRPDIGVQITDDNGSGVDFDRSTVQLARAGHVIATDVSLHGSLVTVTPGVLSPGEVTVAVRAFDRAGNVTERSWVFSVIAVVVVPDTLRVTHDAGGRTLKPGDVLRVTAEGPPGATASFSLGGWQQDLPMSEGRHGSGAYAGSFTVPALDKDREEEVRATLTWPGGRRLSDDADRKVRFALPRLSAPRITSPKAGAAVGDSFVVEGEALPNSTVRVMIVWENQTPWTPPRRDDLTTQTIGADRRPIENPWNRPRRGELLDTRVTTDAGGRFRTDTVSLQVPALEGATKVILTLTAIASAPGHTDSPSVTVKFTR